VPVPVPVPALLLYALLLLVILSKNGRHTLRQVLQLIFPLLLPHLLLFSRDFPVPVFEREFHVGQMLLLLLFARLLPVSFFERQFQVGTTPFLSDLLLAALLMLLLVSSHYQ